MLSNNTRKLNLKEHSLYRLNPKIIIRLFLLFIINSSSIVVHVYLTHLIYYREHCQIMLHEAWKQVLPILSFCANSFNDWPLINKQQTTK